MVSTADGWWNEDRRSLYWSVEVIALGPVNPDRIGLCLDTILNDLELYDDPRQGAGAWLYDNELQVAEQLGAILHTSVDGTRPIEAGRKAVASTAWADAQNTATHLLGLMVSNGDFSR